GSVAPRRASPSRADSRLRCVQANPTESNRSTRISTRPLVTPNPIASQDPIASRSDASTYAEIIGFRSDLLQNTFSRSNRVATGRITDALLGPFQDGPQASVEQLSQLPPETIEDNRFTWLRALLVGTGV
ncbi:MAG: hypothetical protein ABL921_31535, partial [Pirellula sp.]